MTYFFRALRGLLRLGWQTRFRLRGRYWTWRRETAFGKDGWEKMSARDRRHAAMEMGEWADHITNLARTRKNS